MLEAAPVAPTLLLAVSLHRLGVGLPVVLLLAGMRISPLFPAVADDLSVEGIGAKLAPVIITAALLLAGGLATDGLLGTIGGKLEDLLAVTAIAVNYQAAPDQNAIRSFCPELRQLSLAAHIETAIESSTASPPMELAYRNSYRVWAASRPQGR
jgi:hypothetical protein